MSLIGIHIDGKLYENENDPIYSKIKLFQFMVDPLKEIDQNKIRNIFMKNKIRSVIHSSYSINIAKNWSQWDWQVNYIKREIEQCSKLNGFCIVVHLGKRKELIDQVALNNMYTFLLHIHRETLKYKNIKILLETPAGQGSELCYKLEELAQFVNKLLKHQNKEIRERFGVCLDTCHIFAAGYDISKNKGRSEYLKTFDKLIGINNIKLVHVNDSKVKCGDRVDRHENIGNGFIGLDPITKLVSFFSKLQIPMILETPSKGLMIDYNLLSSINN